jgi:DNA modification methylase
MNSRKKMRAQSKDAVVDELDSRSFPMFASFDCAARIRVASPSLVCARCCAQDALWWQICFDRVELDTRKVARSMSLQPNLLCNADSLEFLERVETGIADLVYLDPPWYSARHHLSDNFNRFIDKSSNSLGQHLEKGTNEALSRYIDWVSKIIQQAKRVTKPTGNVVIHTVSNINSYLRLIAERIFEEKLVSEIALQQRKSHAIRRGTPSDEHEKLLLCRCSKDSIYNPSTRPLTHDETTSFSYEDKHGRYRLVDITTKGNSPTLTYEWRGVTPPKDRSWRYSREKMQQLDSEGYIHQSPVNQKITLKTYLDGNANVPLGSVWDDIEPYASRKERVDFPSQQSLVLLERVIAVTTNPDGLVIDPFCGSGTTLVASHRLSRKWLSCDDVDLAIDASRLRLALEDKSPCANNLQYEILGKDSLQKQPKKAGKYFRFYEGLVDHPKIHFVLNMPIDAELEENLDLEFKDVSGSGNPVRSIADHTDKYAIAFLNREGGSILWGILDSACGQKIVGVRLDAKQRDELTKKMTDKLNNIRPETGPSIWRIDFHPVFEAGMPSDALVVVQLTIFERGDSEKLYKTISGKVFQKTDAGVVELSPEAIQAEEKRKQRKAQPKNV